jgi:hypothetical protein
MSMPFYVSPEQFMGQAQVGGPGRHVPVAAVSDGGPATGAAEGQPS